MAETKDNTLDVAICPKTRLRISNDEWFELSYALEQHHTVFYKIWEMGKPVFNEEIETAAVQFDESGRFVWFHFNPKFWKRLQFKDKLFVICHEALHIVLNHGIRTRDCGMNHGATNVAMDIVVNHALVNNFGFDRDNIQDWEDYCWVDTIFKDKNPIPPDNEQFEYYYNLFDKLHIVLGIGEGNTVDDHAKMGQGNWDKIFDELNKGLCPEERKTLKGIVDKHFQKKEKEKEDKVNKQAGLGHGGCWHFSNAIIQKKRKWETVIKKWSKKYLKNTDKEVEQWARIQRRMTSLPRSMFLPSDMEIHDIEHEKTRIKVLFFLDTSGSCWNLKDRFFEAALSLDPKRFDLDLYCFDTKVVKTDLQSRKICGGGGTSFRIIEEEVQKVMAEGQDVESVFVLSDGYGDQLNPQYPQKYHFFLTEGGVKNCFPDTCNCYELKDYE